MRRNHKKLLATLSMTAILTLGVGMSLGNTEVAPVDVDDISVTMLKGAGVRCTGDVYATNGIRFQMTASKSQIDSLEAYAKAQGATVQYGMVIAPKNWVAVKDFTEENLFGTTAVYDWANKLEVYGGGSEQATALHVTMSPEEYEEDDTMYVFNGGVVKMLEENLTREYVAKGYIAYVGADNVVDYSMATYFDGAMENNARSMVYVAQQAIEDGNTYATWLQENYVAKVASMPTQYAIEHYVETPDGSYTKYATTNAASTIGAAVSAADDTTSYEGYTVDETKSESGNAYANDKLALKKYYNVDKSAFVTPDISFARDDEGLKVNASTAADNGNLVLDVNGSVISDSGTAYSGALSQSGVVTAKTAYALVGGTFESEGVSKYIDSTYLANDVHITNAKILADFSTADSLNSVTKGTAKDQEGKEGSVGEPASIGYVSSHAGIYITSTSGLMKVTTSGKQGWQYSFTEPISAANITKIGIKVIYEQSWGERDYVNAFMGLIINGEETYMGDHFSAQAITGVNVLGTETVYSKFIQQMPSLSAVMWVDVSSLGDVMIEGVYAGRNKSSSVYIDSIVYMEKEIVAPTISFARNGDTLSVNVSNEDSTLEVLINDVAQEVTGNTFTATISQNSTIKARSVMGERTGEWVEKYVDADYLATDSQSGGKVLASFSSADSLKQVGDILPPKSMNTASWAPLTVTRTWNETVSAYGYNSTNAMHVAGPQSGSYWSHNGASYTLPQALELEGIVKIGIILNKTWENGGAWYVSVASSGTICNCAGALSIQNYDANGPKGNITTSTGNSVTLTGGGAIVYVDVATLLSLNEGITSIDQISISGYKQEFKIDGIVYMEPEPSWTEAYRFDSADKVTSAVNNGIVAVEANWFTATSAISYNNGLEFGTNSNNGIMVKFDDVDLSTLAKFDLIVSVSADCGEGLYVYANGTASTGVKIKWFGAGVSTTQDLLALLKGEGITTLSSLMITSNRPANVRHAVSFDIVEA